MRALAQLFYFLSTIPGLSFLSRIGSNLTRVDSVTREGAAAARSMSNLKKTKKDENSDKSEK